MHGVVKYLYTGITLHFKINVREHRKGNQRWTFKRTCENWVRKAQGEDKPNTTQYVLDTTYTQTNTNNVNTI